jgi:hypothetical protein
MVVTYAGESAIRKYVCMILELAPYRRRRCFIPGGREVARTALLMVDIEPVGWGGARYGHGLEELTYEFLECA